MSWTQELKMTLIEAIAGDIALNKDEATGRTECSLAWSSTMQLFAFSHKNILVLARKHYSQRHGRMLLALR